MKTKQIPLDYALALQGGGEDVATLSDTLRLSGDRLIHVIKSLKNKGLVHIRSTVQGTPDKTVGIRSLRLPLTS